MPIKLGVNIDHVATLRQARRGLDPDPVAAARVCRAAGADMIVAHLRRDRRHIQDDDVMQLCQGGRFNLHLEMSDAPSVVAAALRAKPDSVCIVPEGPRELTTSGGLDLQASQKPLGRTIARLKKAGIEVSLFVDPDAPSVRLARSLGADAVELCTAEYARTLGRRLQKAQLERLELAAYLASELKLELHAGHGLDYHNVVPVAAITHVSCLNIGFSIVSRALFTGLKAAVAEMKKLISSAR